jgi:hypothetical protein
MSRMVCFIDDEGQVGTCIADDGVCSCDDCPHNDDAHKKWRDELEQKNKESHTFSEFKGKHKFDKEPDENESHLLTGIKNHEITLDLHFVDQDIIIYGSASSEGIQVFGATRCFEDDLGCEDPDCLHCPYVDKSKEQAIFDKWEEPVVEMIKSLYNKVEAKR